ncbi:MAG: hypothetical protein AAF677_03840 [Pseudomonadota bacterium]
MNSQEQAYREAEERIARAHQGKWLVLNLSSDGMTRGYRGEQHRGLRGLKYLTVIPPSIGACAAIECLDLQGTSINDLTPIQDLRQLRILYLSFCPVQNLSPLRELRHLHTLDLYGSKIDNLNVLDQLPDLRFLNIGDTSITDLHPLLHCQRLKNVYFKGTLAWRKNAELRHIASVPDSAERLNLLRDWLRREVNVPRVPAQSAGGIRYGASETFLEPLRDDQVGAAAAALHPQVVRKLSLLGERVGRSKALGTLRESVEAALALLQRDLDAIAAEAAAIWVYSQDIALELERDDGAQRDRAMMSEPLPPDARMALEGVVSIFPVFARQFPVCRELDDEQAAWRRTREVEAVVADIVESAALKAVIRETVAELLRHYTPPAGEGVQADKKARAGVVSARNLVIAAVAAVCGAAGTAALPAVEVVSEEVGHAAVDAVGGREALSRKIHDWITDEKTPIEALLADAPPDMRRAIMDNIRALKDGPAPWQSPPPERKPPG